jgi:hypothetical protein
MWSVLKNRMVPRTAHLRWHSLCGLCWSTEWCHELHISGGILCGLCWRTGWCHELHISGDILYVVCAVKQDGATNYTSQVAFFMWSVLKYRVVPRTAHLRCHSLCSVLTNRVVPRIAHLRWHSLCGLCWRTGWCYELHISGDILYVVCAEEQDGATNCISQVTFIIWAVLKNRWCHELYISGDILYMVCAEEQGGATNCTSQVTFFMWSVLKNSVVPRTAHLRWHSLFGLCWRTVWCHELHISGGILYLGCAEEQGGATNCTSQVAFIIWAVLKNRVVPRTAHFRWHSLCGLCWRTGWYHELYSSGGIHYLGCAEEQGGATNCTSQVTFFMWSVLKNRVVPRTAHLRWHSLCGVCWRRGWCHELHNSGDILYVVCAEEQGGATNCTSQVTFFVWAVLKNRMVPRTAHLRWHSLCGLCWRTGWCHALHISGGILYLGCAEKQGGATHCTSQVTFFMWPVLKNRVVPRTAHLRWHSLCGLCWRTGWCHELHISGDILYVVCAEEQDGATNCTSQVAFFMWSVLKTVWCHELHISGGILYAGCAEEHGGATNCTSQVAFFMWSVLKNRMVLRTAHLRWNSLCGLCWRTVWCHALHISGDVLLFGIVHRVWALMVGLLNISSESTSTPFLHHVILFFC